MTPAAAPGPDTASPPGAVAPSAVSSCRPTVLKKRADFLRAASARRQGAPGLLLQGRDRQDGSAAVRVGFTCSKKLGNAVARNRAKRRLRAAAQAVLPEAAQGGGGYLLGGPPGPTAGRGFPLLFEGPCQAPRGVHGGTR